MVMLTSHFDTGFRSALENDKVILESQSWKYENSKTTKATLSWWLGGRGGLVMKIQRNKLMGHQEWVLERSISLEREREKERQEIGYYSAAGLGVFKDLYQKKNLG